MIFWFLRLVCLSWSEYTSCTATRSLLKIALRVAPRVGRKLIFNSPNYYNLDSFLVLSIVVMFDLFCRIASLLISRCLEWVCIFNSTICTLANWCSPIHVLAGMHDIQRHALYINVKVIQKHQHVSSWRSHIMNRPQLSDLWTPAYTSCLDLLSILSYHAFQLPRQSPSAWLFHSS